MANSTIPNLVAVTVPAGTDLLGVRQSGDARDKKLTVTQLLSLGGDVFKVGTPSAGLFGVWTGDGTIEAVSEVTLGGGVLVLNPGTETRVTGDLRLLTGSGQAPMLVDELSTETNPTICPAFADQNTGLGWIGGDRLSIISGGVSGLVLAELNGAVIPRYDTEPAMTAFAGGGQVSAVQLDHGYNVVATVATTGDSVKLPIGIVFLQGSVVYIKNDGVNACDVFPGSGDNLGAGVDTAISLAAGASVAFIGKTADSIWTQLIFAAGGGGGDVTKVGTPVDNQIGVWTGDGTIEGDSEFLWDGSALTVGFVNAGPQLLNEVATDTNPTIVPTRNDPDTGIGHDAADRFALIAGGVTVAHVLEQTGSPAIVIDPNDAGSGAPELAFGAGADTGWRESANVLTLILGGASKWGWDGDLYVSITATGAGLLNEAASATNPTFVPNRSDLDSGIGQNAVDQVSIIAGGDEIARAVEVVGANQLILSPAGIQDNAAAPSLAFGDGDSGFYESFEDTIRLTLSGVARWVFTGDRFVAHTGNGPSLQNEASLHTNPTLIPALGDPSTGIGGVTGDISLIVGSVEKLRITSSVHIFTGDWQASITAGPIIVDEAATGTNPTLVPRRGDEDTGVGSLGLDTLSLIAGGVEMLRLSEGTTDQVLIGPAGTAAAPSFSFVVDPDTGFYSAVPGILAISVDGIGRFRWVGDQFRGATGGSPSIQNEVASATNPTLLPTQTDLDTGIGWTATDHLSLVAGGLDCINIRETASARQIGFYTTAPISLQTGVAVTEIAIHAALVALGLITA